VASRIADISRDDGSASSMSAQAGWLVAFVESDRTNASDRLNTALALWIGDNL
jgi:hypothetical protein